MLKIAFDASPLLVNKTGVAYYTERLISEMAHRYPDVKFVGFYYNFLSRKKTDHFPRAENISYRPIHFLPSKIIYQLRRWGISPPLEFLLKEKVDFVLFGNFWGYPSLRRTPSAPVIHDLTYLDLPEYVTTKNRNDLTKLVPLQIKRSSFVITVSEFSKQRIIDTYGIKPSDIVVTHIPAPKATVHSSEACKTELTKLGIRKPFILFLSTVEPRKNVNSLIEAYGHLSKNVRDKYTLVIAGRTGWYAESILKRIKQAQNDGLNIVHVGYVSDFAKSILYQSAALYVNPSHYEGFGMPILEAMSHGTPVAVSNIPVFKEVVGDSGFYFDPEDPKDISQVLQKALKKPTDHKYIMKQVSRLNWKDVANKVMKKIEASLANN